VVEVGAHGMLPVERLDRPAVGGAERRDVHVRDRLGEARGAVRGKEGASVPAGRGGGGGPGGAGGGRGRRQGCGRGARTAEGFGGHTATVRGASNAPLTAGSRPANDA